MNKKILIAIIGFILLAGGSTAYLYLSKNNSADRQAAESAKTEPRGLGKYVEYSASAVAEAEGAPVLFFYAPWCPLCRAIEAEILRQGVPDGYTIIKVDHDGNQALRQKYGVTVPNTFVKVDEAGNFIDSYVAYRTPLFDTLKRDFL